jgi:hypothetical protein
MILDLYALNFDSDPYASLHDMRSAPAAAGSLISEAGQIEMVEANLHDLGSCATPVVPELGGKGM